MSPENYPDLPKWPKMLVTGEPVTVEQAKEIIRRTDQTFAYITPGNDRAFSKWVFQTVGAPFSEPFSAPFHVQDRWRTDWGFITTSYVHNDWITCSYIDGPHGWCHPDGQIGFVDNIGKWPSVGEVVDDWRTLQAVFPFLKVGVTLYSGEWCEEDIHPLVSFQVGPWGVETVDPKEVNVHEGHPEATRAPVGCGLHSNCAIPREWIEDWGAEFKKENPS